MHFVITRNTTPDTVHGPSNKPKKLTFQNVFFPFTNVQDRLGVDFNSYLWLGSCKLNKTDFAVPPPSIPSEKAILRDAGKGELRAYLERVQFRLLIYYHSSIAGSWEIEDNTFPLNDH